MRDYNLDLDDFCYEPHHIKEVFEKNFVRYFDIYILSRGGKVVTNEAIESLKEKSED